MAVGMNGVTLKCRLMRWMVLLENRVSFPHSSPSNSPLAESLSTKRTSKLHGIELMQVAEEFRIF